jgi:nitrous oxidase accessory protein NosD
VSSRRLAVALLLAGLVVGGMLAIGADDEDAVVVAPGESITEAAASHDTVVLGAGRHQAFTLDATRTVRALPGAVVSGGVVVRADGARLEDLHVVGGESGIRVDGARDVLITGAVIEGSTWHGIEVVAGTATIRDCRISGLASPLAQGIEIRNGNGLGRSHVQRCVVEGGQEGIVSHVGRVEVRDNDVSGTTMRGIAITEMSEGLVEANDVDAAVGTGLFCGDMSHCEVRENRVRDVAPDPAGIRSRGGQSLVAWYYSTLRARGNDFDSSNVAGETIGVYHGSVTTDRFPLSHWPAGWRGALPGAWVTGIALAALAAIRSVLHPVSAALRRRWTKQRPVPGVAVLGAWAFAVTAVVQLFHFAEHGVQVHQVYVADAEIRTGIVGARFDTEWIHLGFNATVLVGTVVGIALTRAELVGRLRRVLPWLLVGTVIQGWHVVEHVARVLQHLDTGVSPAPGIFGDDIGLVWFHYAINVPITAALALTVTAWLRTRPSDVGQMALAGGARREPPVMSTA